MDVLAIGAHPDDAELGVGGLIHKMTAAGHEVGMLDLSAGEMGTRGSGEERREEALKAAGVLGVARREFAGLPDGGIANIPEQQRRVVQFIRELRPAVLMVPHVPDRHPDHTAAHELARDANFFSGLAKLDTGQAPHRARDIYYYRPYSEYASDPPFVVDISDHFEVKLEALRAYASQFANPNYAGTPTFVSSDRFWDGIRVRAAYWGYRIGAAYGEPLFTDGPVALPMLPGLEKSACASE